MSRMTQHSPACYATSPPCRQSIVRILFFSFFFSLLRPVLVPSDGLLSQGSRVRRRAGPVQSQTVRSAEQAAEPGGFARPSHPSCHASGPTTPNVACPPPHLGASAATQRPVPCGPGCEADPLLRKSVNVNRYLWPLPSPLFGAGPL